MDDCHIIGWQRKLRPTHILLPMWACIRLTCIQRPSSHDNKGETPIDIARRSGACADIISLLSLTPEEVRSLGWKGMLRLYAPVRHRRNEMVGWIQSRSYADCHKWISFTLLASATSARPHDESVRPVQNQLLLRRVPKSSVEEAQEDVQNPNHPSSHQGQNAETDPQVWY